jgi:DNA-binding transcriptional LysR family regulator
MARVIGTSIVERSLRFHPDLRKSASPHSFCEILHMEARAAGPLSAADWQDLRHFAALAREGSLSAAARSLQVDHVTVARRVAALEAALKLHLVDRRARRYTLTAEGKRIAAVVDRMAEAALDLDRIARGAQRGIAGSVSITAPPGLAATLIAPRLAVLHRAHPGIVVRLIGEKRTASLSRREADIAVRLSRPQEQALVARRVASLTFGLYGAPEYLRRQPPAAYGFIAFDDGMETAQQQVWLKAFAAGRPIVLLASDIETQRAAAAGGLGIAALPRYLGDGDPKLERLAAEGRSVSREIWLAVHSDLQRTPLVRTVLEFLAGCFRDLR